MQKQIDEIRALSDKFSEELKAMQAEIEEMKAAGELTIPKDGQASISARGSVNEARKSTS